MKRTKLILGLLAIIILAAYSAQATTVIGTFGAGFTSNTNNWPFVGQTFTVPVADTTLTQWAFDIAGRTSAGDIDFYIRDWNGTTIGATDYSAVVPWSTSPGIITLSGLNLNLVAGNTYIAIYDLLGYMGQSIRYGNDAYTNGQGTWGNSLADLESYAPGFAGYDTSFEATFSGTTAVPEPATISLLGIGLFGLIGYRWRHQKR